MHRALTIYLETGITTMQQPTLFSLAYIFRCALPAYYPHPLYKTHLIWTICVGGFRRGRVRGPDPLSPGSSPASYGPGLLDLGELSHIIFRLQEPCVLITCRSGGLRRPKMQSGQ